MSHHPPGGDSDPLPAAIDTALPPFPSGAKTLPGKITAPGASLRGEQVPGAGPGFFQAAPVAGRVLLQLPGEGEVVPYGIAPRGIRPRRCRSGTRLSPRGRGAPSFRGSRSPVHGKPDISQPFCRRMPLSTLSGRPPGCLHPVEDVARVRERGRTHVDWRSRALVVSDARSSMRGVGLGQLLPRRGHIRDQRGGATRRTPIISRLRPVIRCTSPVRAA
jgi:hypothetical protein